MNLRKFIAPNIAILLFLSIFWFAGIEPVIKPDRRTPGNEHQKNLRKYLSVQRDIIDNYVDKVDLTSLYKKSIKGLVSHLNDSTASLKNTPADTSFTNMHISNLHSSFTHFDQAYRYISDRYPHENMSNLTADAIESMMAMLDPHSIYISPERSKRVEQEFSGKFEGVGIQFVIPHDTITVVSVISGGPSDKLGIRSGDRIIGIGDSSAVGFTSRQVQQTLRGPKGTKVDVTIKRPQVKDPIHYTITRDEIPLYTVDATYMLDDETGYIKINRFAATTHKEFMQGVKKLHKKGMDRLVIDLRNNPGGYLSQAIAIAEEFYPKGTEIVSTKSRHPRFTESYKSRRNGKLQHTPLIILVNSGSASASEIVSGAIQDHDRGLIVGQRTFGKGLVQQQYGLVDSSNIRVTIARYYTPSGRLIQKPYTNKGKEAYAYEIYKRSSNARTDVHQFLSHVADSLKHRTDAGRIVYGGGGIVPDHIVQEDTSRFGPVFRFMQRKQILFDFVNGYLNKHRAELQHKWGENYEDFRKNFHWQQQDFDQVRRMMRDDNLIITDKISKTKAEGDTLYIPEGYFRKAQDLIGGVLKANLAEQLWNPKKYYPIFNDIFNNALAQSMKLWPQARAFANGHVSAAADQQTIGESNRL